MVQERYSEGGVPRGHDGASVRGNFSARRRRVGMIRARSNGTEPYLSAYLVSESAQRAQQAWRVENCVCEGAAERGGPRGGKEGVVR